MKAHLIAQTYSEALYMVLATKGAWEWPSPETTDADALAEFAGRVCYQSFNRPNPDTASNPAYLANILEQGHESVLAHASATFYLTGVSRSLTHQLIRHRWLAFSEMSERYCDIGDLECVLPPAIAADEEKAEDLIDEWRSAGYIYQNFVDYLEATGHPRKRAREAARAVLPSCTETRIVVTGNMRAWRDFLRQRLSPHADAEIRQLAQEILHKLRGIAPATFQDFEEVTN